MQGGKLTGEHVSFNGDEHVLIIGPTRSGKSRRLIMPNLLMDTEHSALVIDIKGELHGMTAAKRAATGHEIITLDPFGVTGASTGFNPLTQLRPGPDFVDDATGIAEALIQVPNTDPHWAESAQDLVAGFIMYDWLLGTIEPDPPTQRHQPSLRNVRRYVTLPTDAIASLANDAINRVEIEGWDPAVANKLAAYKEITAASREMLSIISNAKTQTGFLDSPPIAADLEKPGFDFAAMKDRRMTVYLILEPKRLHLHARWLRLMVDAAIRDMQRKLRRQGQREVLFILDEFAQLGTMQSIEVSMSLNAGYGVKVVAAIQHLGQLKQHYRENWETFLSGGMITTFAPRDVLTSEHLSRLAGQEWKEVETTSSDGKGGGSVSISKQLQSSVLAQEFRRMARGMMIAFIPTPEGGQVMRRIQTRDISELRL